jgi:hypothetical protein
MDVQHFSRLLGHSGAKDQEGACFSSVGNNLVLQDENQDLLVLLVFTGQ